jgi:hypothetical protein
MEPGASLPRILLEWTSTQATTLNTGIQRVVRNLCRHGPQVGAALDVPCLPVVCAAGRLFPGPWRPSSASTKGSVRGRESSLLRRLLQRLGARLYRIFFPRTLYRHG